MSFVMQCPFCAKQVTLPDDAKEASCPKCHMNFTFADSNEDIGADKSDTGSASVLAGPTADATESVLTPWISPWGVAAFAFGAAAFFLPALSIVAPSLGVSRYLTVALAAAGGVMTLVGILATAENRDTKDSVWLTLAAFVSLVVFSLAVFNPQILNPRWAMEFTVPVEDPNKLVVVPRDQPRDAGKPLAPDGWADAATEAIREADVLILLESVKVGPAAGKEGEPRLLIHFKIASTAHERKIKFIGFDHAKRLPTLTDEIGKSYAFIEQRAREIGKGPPWVWLAGPQQPVDVMPSRAQEFLLVFDAPSGTFAPLRLELPASAWGRQGVAKLRITRYIKQKLYEGKDEEQP